MCTTIGFTLVIQYLGWLCLSNPLVAMLTPQPDWFTIDCLPLIHLQLFEMSLLTNHYNSQLDALNGILSSTREFHLSIYLQHEGAPFPSIPKHEGATAQMTWIAMPERLITFSCLLQCREAWSISLAFAIVDTLALFTLIPPFKSTLLSWLIPPGNMQCLSETPFIKSHLFMLFSSLESIITHKHLFTGMAQCLAETPKTMQHHKGPLTMFWQINTQMPPTAQRQHYIGASTALWQTTWLLVLFSTSIQ